jgi:hypothetical protein
VDYGFPDMLAIMKSSLSPDLRVFSLKAEVSAPRGDIVSDEMICLPGSGKNAKRFDSFAA